MFQKVFSIPGGAYTNPIALDNEDETAENRPSSPLPPRPPQRNQCEIEIEPGVFALTRNLRQLMAVFPDSLREAAAFTRQNKFLGGNWSVVLPK
ncbi:unnamed protein product [Haemonchus placei]|uniref:Uncharacterized protein n=1 Tax=Haemonchus placei TaxID=6290 RepID=A0A0N4WYH1_HAEPC|nr:unnamed protein product [Haemonchus placei]